MDNRGFQGDSSETKRKEIDHGIDNLVRKKGAMVASNGIVNIDVAVINEFAGEYARNEKGDDIQSKENRTDVGNFACRKRWTGNKYTELESNENFLKNGRKITSQKDLDDTFQFGTRSSQTLKQLTTKQLSKCSAACLKRFVCSIFPFINIMKNYNIKEDIPGDIVAGLTVGILHIPQGMAYALLATLSPVYGLYSSFFPVLVYFFFGSSKHISLGTASVPCLMIGTAVSKGIESITGPFISPGAVPALSENRSWNSTDSNTENHVETTTATADDFSGMSEDQLDLRLQFAMSVTFIVGVIQLLMSIFRLGFMTDYMSDALVSGFTTGVACHVFTSQIRYIFSVKLTSYSGVFKIVYTYRDFFGSIGTTNYITVLLSVSSMVVLYCTSRFINQNPRLKPKMFIPVPIELIVVIIGTVISYVLNLEENHNVDVVSDIPTGLPIPNTKGLSRISWTILIDAFPIAIVIFSISISIAKVLAKKHNYEVDANQELFAFGMSTIVCSFMSSVTPMAALSRATVQERVGGRTQVAGLVSCCLLLVVLLAIGPYFKTTPKSVLASVIVVSLRALFLQMFELKKIYRLSKTDFFVWIVAFASTVLLDVDLGLGVAVAFNILTVICRVQRPHCRLMGLLPGTNLYRDVHFYREAKELPGIKIVRYEQSLFFLNKEHFRSCLIKNTVNPAKLTNAHDRGERKHKSEIEIPVQTKSETVIGQELAKSADFNVEGIENNRSDVDLHTIILDCSPWSFVDTAGVQALVETITDYKAVGVKVFLTNCSGEVLNVFEKTKFYNTVDRSYTYVTMHEAVLQARCQHPSEDSVQSQNIIADRKCGDIESRRRRKLQIVKYEDQHKDNVVISDVRGHDTAEASENILKNEGTITTQKDLEDNFHFGTRPSKTLMQLMSKQLSKCSAACLKHFVCSVFPFVNIMKDYNIKEDIPRDIVAGLTVGILHIPQGMAYALLATLSPVYGLYSSFFPVLVYFLFGSSKHISLGTAAIPCLMIGTAVSKGINSVTGPAVLPTLVPALTEDRSWTSTENHTENHVETTTATADDISGMSEDELDLRLQFAMSVTFMAGVIQLLMSIFRLGFITDYMSDALASGFITGVACHVFTSQVRNILGINLTSYTGTFKLVYTYRDVFRNIATTNYITVLLCVSSMVVLYCTSRFINLNPRLKPKMCMPVPIELIVVVIGTVISYVLKLEENHNVDVVSDIPTGLPMPNTKGLSRISGTIVIDAFPIVIVIFSISISMAKLIAKKHNYEVDANQELFAFGLSSVVCSFMSSVTPMAALSRSVVQDRVGGRTQVAGLVSCCLLLVVLLAIGPYFKTTPKCVLASVIVVSLRAMFLQMFDLKKIYRVSKTDSFVWIVAFVATVLLDVDLGLGVAAAFNILTAICKVQRPYFRLMGLLPGTDLYRDIHFYHEAKEIPGIKIVRYEQSLFFLNKEHFRSFLFKNTVNPATLASAKDRRERKLKQMQTKKALKISVQNKSEKKKDQETKTRTDFNVEGQQRNLNEKSNVDFHTIILDCSHWSFVDSMGVQALAEVITEYKAVDINVILANCTGEVLNVFEKTKFYNTADKSNIYASLHDAVLRALCQQSSTDSMIQIDNTENLRVETEENKNNIKKEG